MLFVARDYANLSTLQQISKLAVAHPPRRIPTPRRAPPAFGNKDLSVCPSRTPITHAAYRTPHYRHMDPSIEPNGESLR
jgi:hypothetical protein